MTNIGGRIGQFHYNPAHPPRERSVDGIKFIVGVSTALNAMGLIGTEYNGLFILDDTNKRVVLDQHKRGASGGFGPSAEQLAALDEVMALSKKDFLAFIKAHPHYRGGL